MQLCEAESRPQRLALGPLVAVEPDLRRPWPVGADLDERRTELGVQDVEVVGADATFLPEEVKRRDARLARAVPRAPDPLELLSHDQRDDSEAAVALGPLNVWADVIELAVIPAGAIRRLQPQHRDLVRGDEPARLGPEAVADPPKQSRRGDRMTEMAAQEPHDLPGNLQAGHVRVQKQPVDTLDLERHMTLEHLVDVRHARHNAMVNANDWLCPPSRPALDGGRPGGGPAPLPLMEGLANRWVLWHGGGGAHRLLPFRLPMSSDRCLRT